MIFSEFKDVRLSPVTESEAKDVNIRWLIGKETGAPFYMRVLEIGPEGNTPFHNHEWEHEIFVLEGEGVLKTDNGEYNLEYGRFAFIQKNENHQFINTSVNTTLRFICLIPEQKI